MIGVLIIFIKNDKMDDDFGITWNKDYKKQQYEHHRLKEMGHIIHETDKITLGFMQRYKTKETHAPRYRSEKHSFC